MKKFRWVLVALFIVVGGGVLFLPRLIIGRGEANAQATQSALNFRLTEEFCIAPLPVLNPERIAHGKQVYQRECLDCHGENLQGQPGWRERLKDGSKPPPPLDNTGNVTHRSDASLLTILNYGLNYGKQSAMPGYQDILTDDEQMAVYEYMKSFWDADFFSHQHSLSASVRLGWVEPAAQGEDANLYLILDNPASYDTRLIGARSEMAEKVEIVDAAGKVLEDVDLPYLTLEINLLPGETHLVMRNLKQTLEVGDRFWLRVRFTGVGEVMTEIKVIENSSTQ